MHDRIAHDVQPVHPVAVEVARRALATVTRHARGPEDLALLAEALGLPLTAGGGPPAPGARTGYVELARAVALVDEGQAPGVEVGL
ncbi:hypothetical protein [Frankia sp. EAN1pec]|uniref:hypothetical protein n=1 Tax=Parafrankia sp. (strain EAN1pec) TaxID=298653 RepID=UPI0012F9D46A